MSFQKSSLVRLLALSFITVAFSSRLSPQTAPAPQFAKIDKPKQSADLAGKNNLYCAGFIQSSAISTGNKIIGGQDEADKFIYAQNDFLYINMGSDKGVNVGDIFVVVRPRGAVKSKWTEKSKVGFYVQELGSVEVVDVKREVSVARVKNIVRQPSTGRPSPTYTPADESCSRRNCSV